jgi:DNA repair protein RecO (recombination protein O)
MEWHDKGVILSVRRHGETSAIAEVLSAEHGRCLGLVRGGRSRRQRPVLQPGNRVALSWRARLEEHLGTFVFEPIALEAGTIMEDPFRLAGLGALAGLARLLPEREPHRRIYEALVVVLDAIDNDEVWPALIVRWELGLLDELGFGLDLSQCAATGRADDLVFVSPKTGRAVNSEAGRLYADRLLRLPPFLAAGRLEGSKASPSDIVAGFHLTGYFLDRHVFEPRGLNMPEPRERVVRQVAAMIGDNNGKGGDAGTT